MDTLSCRHFPSINRHLECGFFIKTLIIMCISTNMYRSYVCDPIDKLSCQHVGCQATPRTLGDMEYVRTPS